MAFQKGHKFGKGNSNSGRKTKLEEIKNVLAEAKAIVTQEALIELANSKVYQFLQQAANIDEVKSLGLPITLKGMTDKLDLTSKGESIVNTERVKTLADELRRNNRRGSIGGDGTSSDTMGTEI